MTVKGHAYLMQNVETENILMIFYFIVKDWQCCVEGVASGSETRIKKQLENLCIALQSDHKLEIFTIFLAH